MTVPVASSSAACRVSVGGEKAFRSCFLQADGVSVVSSFFMGVRGRKEKSSDPRGARTYEGGGARINRHMAY